MTDSDIIKAREAEDAKDVALFDAATMAARLRLWFFRELSDEQRLSLFKLTGMPVAELRAQGHQLLALKHIIKVLRADEAIIALRAEREGAGWRVPEGWRLELRSGRQMSGCLMGRPTLIARRQKKGRRTQSARYSAPCFSPHPIRLVEVRDDDQ